MKGHKPQTGINIFTKLHLNKKQPSLLPVAGHEIKDNPIKTVVFYCSFLSVLYLMRHRIGVLDIDACCGRVAFEKEGQEGGKSLCMVCIEGTAADIRVNV